MQRLVEYKPDLNLLIIGGSDVKDGAHVRNIIGTLEWLVLRVERKTRGLVGFTRLRGEVDLGTLVPPIIAD